MSNNKKYTVLQKECVACGCCMKKCPKGAIQVIHGMYAQIDESKCIGCGICMRTCPASVIVPKEGI